MANNKITITDATTGETIERLMTNEEQAERDAVLAEAEAQQAAENAQANKAAEDRATAEAKLAALGLTSDDLRALGL
jgi:hypothetical protein